MVWSRDLTGASVDPVRSKNIGSQSIAANNYKRLCGAGTYTAVKLPNEDGEKPSAVRSFSRLLASISDLHYQNFIETKRHRITDNQKSLIDALAFFKGNEGIVRSKNSIRGRYFAHEFSNP